MDPPQPAFSSTNHLYRSSTSPAPRYASMWDSILRSSNGIYPVASDIAARIASVNSCYSTSTSSDDSDYENIAARKASIWGPNNKIMGMTTSGITPVGTPTRALSMTSGQRLAVGDIEVIMYIYGVVNNRAVEIVKKIDPTRSGSFKVNSQNKMIMLASTIIFCDMKDPLSNLRHASKCFQDNLLSPLHFAAYISQALTGSYLGQGAPFMMVGMDSILGILRGSSNRLLGTRDVKTFTNLWSIRNPKEAQHLITLISDDYNGHISCKEFYNLLYCPNLTGKQRIDQITDTLSQQNPSMFFILMDKDEDGFLSSADLRSFAAIFDRCPTDEAVDRATRRLDKDGDGKISLDDFCRAMAPILDGMTWDFWLVAILLTLEL
ncbi:unnamed protein product [Amaranthus hypochondriacus]